MFARARANTTLSYSGSQFFITVGPTPHLDQKHVVFGFIEEGWETVKLVESMGSRSGLTKKRCVIRKSGVLEEGQETTSF